METGLERPSPYSLSDAELVDLAAEGDAAAFDCLVLRHRESALDTARSVLGDWNMAEDAAQHALLEAFRGLKGLHDGEKFKAWLMTITRRCALRLIRAEPQTLEFCESVMQPLVEPLVPDSLSDAVRAHLHELSSRSRRVITLHYLDGYSCREIGNQLRIPEGTIKRILHESRNSLRASMGVELPRATGGREMSTKTGPRDLVWWINGIYPGPYVRDKLTESICLAVNKTAKTAQEIGKIIDANPEFVKEAAHPLVLEELLVRADDSLLANFVALDADDWVSLTKDARARGKEVAGWLESHLPELEEAWRRSTLPARGFDWQMGIWATLAIFVCNHGVARNSAAPPLPEPPVHPDSGKRYCAGGREFIPDEELLWCVGLSSYMYPEFAYGYFWSFGLARSNIGYSPDWATLLHAIDLGISEIALISEKACQPVDRVRDHIARLIESGAIRREDGNLALTFPVVRQEDSDAIVPTVDRVCSELSSEILAPATADVADELRTMGYGHLESQFPEWRRWFEGNICGEALKELMSRGILPDPGSPAPANFCLVGWKGQLPLMSWR